MATTLHGRSSASNSSDSNSEGDAPVIHVVDHEKLVRKSWVDEFSSDDEAHLHRKLTHAEERCDQTQECMKNIRSRDALEIHCEDAYQVHRQIQDSAGLRGNEAKSKALNTSSAKAKTGYAHDDLDSQCGTEDNDSRNSLEVGSSFALHSDNSESRKHEDAESDSDHEEALRERKMLRWKDEVSKRDAVRLAAETGFSLSKDEDIVLCQMYGSHRLLHIKMLSWLFNDAEIIGHDAIKNHVWSFLDEPLMWQFQSDEEWIDCDVLTQQALKVAEAQGESYTTVKGSRWIYLYEIEGHCQTNLSSGKKRSLRRRNPWVTVATPLVHMGGPCTESRWQFSTGFGWADCEEILQVLLGDAEARGDSQVEMYPYLLDLSLMKQTNLNVESDARELRCIRIV